VTAMGDRPDETRTWARAEYDELYASMRRRSALVGIMGLGYVGLALAAAFGERGFRRLGVDIGPQKRAALEQEREWQGGCCQPGHRSLVREIGK
jgi:UDP-N-acetyl-D-mannosaminuronate dehydrogenase